MAKLKEKIGQGWAAYQGFLTKRWAWLIGVAVVLLCAGLLAWALATGRLELGFDEYTPSTAGAERAKTLWDLMDLPLVPVLLALGAWPLKRRLAHRASFARTLLLVRAPTWSPRGSSRRWLQPLTNQLALSRIAKCLFELCHRA